MFSNLRQNGQVYIFHKGQHPKLEIGQVTNIPLQKPKYAVPTTFGNPQEMVVDLVVKVGDSMVNYNSLPSTADIADSYSNGEQIVISDNREAMNAEIVNYKQKSLDTINSIETHQLIVKECEAILNHLNPEYAEKKQQQDEISTLKGQVSEMNKSLSVLTGMIEQLTKRSNEQNVGNS